MSPFMRPYPFRFLLYFRYKVEGGNNMKGLTEIIFILDRSGSMSGLESDTIGGFNSLINKQKKEDGQTNTLQSILLWYGRNTI